MFVFLLSYTIKKAPGEFTSQHFFIPFHWHLFFLEEKGWLFFEVFFFFFNLLIQQQYSDSIILLLCQQQTAIKYDIT